MKLPAWTWKWTWEALMRWGKLQLDTEPTGAERWLVATAVIQAGIRSYYVDPVCRWIMAKSPAWSVKARLKKAGNGWYLLTTQASVTHCRLRFDVYPIDVGDLLRCVSACKIDPVVGVIGI